MVWVYHLVAGDSGSFYAAGHFTTVNGDAQTRIAQFNEDGSPVAATVFANPDINNGVTALARQADGRLLIGGTFTSVGGQTRSRLARLNADGTLDPSFGDMGLNAQPYLNGLLPLPGNRLLIGGRFTEVLGQTRNRIALLNDVYTGYHTVTAAVDGANGSAAPATQMILLDQPATITLTPDPGHVVDRNNVNTDCGGGFNADGTVYTVSSVPGNCTVTFRFVPLLDITTEVQLNGNAVNNAGTLVCDPNPVAVGVSSRCTYTPAAGYELESFSNTCVAISGTPNECETPVTANTAFTVIAHVRHITYTVTPSVPGGNGSVAPAAPVTVNSGDSAAFTLTPDNGYQPSPNVGGSCGAGAWNGNVYTVNSVVADCSVVFSFDAVQPTTYTATASINGGNGAVNPPAHTVNVGDSAAFTLTPDNGYQPSPNVGGSCGAGVWNGNVYTVNSVIADCSVEFSFTQLPTYTITITANPANAGQVSCNPNPVMAGGSTTCTAVANAGYTFDGFSGACNGDVCVLNNVMADAVVTANFIANNYTITPMLSLPGSGNFSCNPNPVPHGQSARCTFVPAPGYVLEGFENCTAVAGEPNVCDTGPLQMGDIEVLARARFAAHAPVLVPVNHPLTQLLLLLALSGLALFALQRRGQ